MVKKESFMIPASVVLISKTLENNGFEAYLIGGCVRDLLIGRQPNDWDITTNAVPEKVIEIFPKTFYENEYGTVGVINEKETDETVKVVEITPYRMESKYSNKRHPDSVKFSNKLEDDLKRRDFTINAVALKIGEQIEDSLYKGHVIDLYKGQEDIESGIIRAVGNPNERFEEDALRMLRAIRIASELRFTIHSDTKSAILNHSDLLKHISTERIRDEFIRTLQSPNPMKGLILSHELGILRQFLPELEKGIGIKQNKSHSYDVWEHCLRTLQHAADKNWTLEIRLAALFHDIAKTETRRWADEKKEWTFYGHDVVGSRVTAKILARMLFPKKTVDTVANLVRWHMFFSDTDQITLSSVRRLLGNVGQDKIWDLMNLRACDRIGTGRPKESPYRLRKYKAMIEEVLHDPVTVGMLKIDGGKVMQITKIAAGPKVGHILHALLEEVMDKPELNSPETLEKRVIQLSKLSEKKLKELGEKGKERKEDEEKRTVKEIRDKYWVE